MLNDFDITDIEKVFADTIRDLGVSDHVWNNRPKVVDDSISDFAVVKVSGGVPMRIGKYIADHTPRYVGDTADDFGFHTRIISFSVIIKSA